jgi:hypothetical protein
MPPQSHRLIFNSSRGCVMAVAETSCSIGKSNVSGATRSNRNKSTRRSRRTELQASNRTLALAPITLEAINLIAIIAPPTPATATPTSGARSLPVPVTVTASNFNHLFRKVAPQGKGDDWRFASLGGEICGAAAGERPRRVLAVAERVFQRERLLACLAGFFPQAQPAAHHGHGIPGAEVVGLYGQHLLLRLVGRSQLPGPG